MNIYKVRSKVLSKALETSREYPILTCYMDPFSRRTEDDCFVCFDNPCCKTDLHATMEDFICNEGASEEPQKLFAIGKELFGKEIIDLKILNKVIL